MTVTVICSCVCMLVCLRVYNSLCVCLRASTCIRVVVFVYSVYAYACVYVCVCVCVRAGETHVCKVRDVNCVTEWFGQSRWHTCGERAFASLLSKVLEPRPTTFDLVEY